MTTTAVNMTSDRSLTLCDATGGAFPIYLPAAADSLGRVLTFKKVDASANAVTIDAYGADTIDGDPTASLPEQHDGITITAGKAPGSELLQWWSLVVAGVDAHADVTDATSVAAAGAFMTSSFLAARKSGDEAIANDNTYTADADLAVSVVENTNYVIDVAIVWDTDTNPDFKLMFTCPAGCTLVLPVTVAQEGTSVEDHDIYAASTGIAWAALNTNNLSMVGQGTLEVAGVKGTFSVDWAQDTSHADNTTLHEGSYIRLMEIV